MKTFIKVTAIALITIGVLIMLGGLVAGLAAAAGGGMYRFPGPDGRMPYVHPPGMRAGMGLLFTAALLVQGLLVTAVGQGLYLLNHLALPDQPARQAPAAAPAPRAPRKAARK